MTGQLIAAVLPGAALFAGLVGLLLPGGARRAATWLALGVTGALALLALWCAADALGSLGVIDIGASDAAPIDLEFSPAVLGDLSVTTVLRLDGLAALVACLVTLIALAVQVYSTAHLAGDARYVPYAAQVTLFTGAMLLVVCAGDLITLLVGWELMGLCSYLLIGHDRSNPAAPSAARKAFVVTRVGDIGFLLGIVLLAADAGSFRFDDLGAASGATQTAAGLLMFAGIAGKSAQFPLHTWLPDAMAGPTPVSALIHSATMVAAGVLVIARLDFVFLGSDAVRIVIASVGALSILLGAGAALAADDLKRVLAWSTISQLGYMTAGLAVSPGVGPPLFHMFSHAVFKALLFLSAGAVIVAVGSSGMARMGGLRRSIPITAACTAVGLGALAGVPPLSGFWSKGSLLSIAGEDALHGTGATALVGWLLLVAGMVAVPLTAAYCARVWLLVFAGEHRGAAAPREPGFRVLGPLIALTVPAALLGWAAVYGQFGGWWSAAERVYATDLFAPSEALTPVLDVALTSLGGLGAWWLWRRSRVRAGAVTAPETYPSADPARVLGRLRPVLASGWYTDTAQRVLVVTPVRVLARAARSVDERGIDGAVRGIGRLTGRCGTAVAAWHSTLGRYVSFAAAGAIGLVLVTLLVMGVRR
ncbi:MAG: NADH-quinone oxidoreductase subunit 5 family protein [Mycobacteriales bacterium]